MPPGAEVTGLYPLVVLAGSCGREAHQFGEVVEPVECVDLLDDPSGLRRADDAVDVVEEFGLDVAVTGVGMVRVAAYASLGVGQDTAVLECDVELTAQ
jgi:hypothetical protein